MSKSVKTVLAILAAALVAVVGFIAINNSSKSNSSASSSTNGEPIKISFWHAMTGPYAQALDDRINEFNNSQKKYKIEATAQGDYTTLNQKILAAAKSKTLPVMAQATYTQVPDLAKNGIVQSLDSQVNGSDGLSKADLDNIYPGYLQQTKYNGKYYSMPFSASVRVMFYNKSILDQYHLSVPKTWDDIKKMAEVLKPEGIAAVGFDKSFDAEWNGMVRSTGTQLVTSSGKVNIDSEPAVKAMELIHNMLEDGTAKTAGSDIYGTTNFVNGKTALTFSSSAGIAATKAAAPADFNWGSAPIPSYDGKSATQFAGNNLILTSQAKKDEAAGAFAFMKFLSSDKQTEKWAEATGYLPITKKAANSESYKKYLDANPLAKAASESLPGAFSDNAFLGYQDYRGELTSTIDSIITNQSSPKDALANLAKKTKELINQK